MQRMYAQWREEERKIRGRREAQEEEAEFNSADEKLGAGLKGRGASGSVGGKKSRKGKKTSGAGAGTGDDSDSDPWAELSRKKASAMPSTGLVGLHDVVQAPPTFTKLRGRSLG